MTRQLWYITKYFAPEDAVSAGSRGWNLIKHLDKKRFKTTVFTSDSNMFLRQGPNREAVEEYLKDDVRLVFLKTLQYSRARSLRRIISWLHFEFRLMSLSKRSYPRPDIILVSSLSIFTIASGLFFSWRYKSAIIFEVRDIWPLTLIEEGGFSRYNPAILLISWLEKLGYMRSDGIIGTMPNLAEHVKKVTGHSLAVSCLPMGVSNFQISNRQDLPDNFINRYFRTEKMTVVYAGSIGTANALDVLFAAARICASCSSIEFVVVGDGDLKHAYMELTQDLENVRFAPKVPPSQVQAVLNEADVVYFSTFPSAVWNYGQSLNKIVDYMLAGKPIVGSYSGFYSMINEAKCGYLVEANNSEALADIFFQILQMPSEDRLEMGMRGQKWITENRRYERLAEEFADILDKAIRVKVTKGRSKTHV